MKITTSDFVIFDLGQDDLYGHILLFLKSYVNFKFM